MLQKVQALSVSNLAFPNNNNILGMQKIKKMYIFNPTKYKVSNYQ